MPASRHRSRSPVIARAVSATIGMWPPVLLPRADQAGRFEAVHLRHVHVHQHEVERAPSATPRPPRARSAPRRPVAPLVSMPSASSGSRGCPRPGGCGVSRPSGWATGDDRRVRARSRRGPSAVITASSTSDWRERLGDVGADAEVPAAGQVAPVAGRGQHHHRRAAIAGVVADPLGQREAVHLRHVRSRAGPGGTARPRAPRSPAAPSAVAPLSAVCGRHPPGPEHLAQDAAVGGVVVHHQHRAAHPAPARVGPSARHLGGTGESAR